MMVLAPPNNSLNPTAPMCDQKGLLMEHYATGSSSPKLVSLLLAGPDRKERCKPADG